MFGDPEEGRITWYKVWILLLTPCHTEAQPLTAGSKRGDVSLVYTPTEQSRVSLGKGRDDSVDFCQGDYVC